MKSGSGPRLDNVAEPVSAGPNDAAAWRHWRTAGRLTRFALASIGISPSRSPANPASRPPLGREDASVQTATSTDLLATAATKRAESDFARQLLVEGSHAHTNETATTPGSSEVEERRSMAIGSLPIAFYRVEVDERFSGPRFLSEGFANAMGYEPDAFIRDRDLWAARIHRDDLARVTEQLERIGDSGELSVEYRWRCADGSERTFLDQGRLVRDEAGAPKEILGACIDVTYRAQIEHELLQSQKIEAIVRLTGGLAHDLNNNLSVVMWNLDLLSRLFKGSGKDFERVQNAMSGAENCTDLLNRLLIFARQKAGEPIILDPRELVTAAGRQAGTIGGDKIKIDVKLPDVIDPILVDPAQMERALFSLTSNARDAMPDGGTLTYECANVGEHVAGLLAQNGVSYVVMTVTDTGIGMPQDIVDCAFEPFFTTKAAGTGSGLGLSMVYGFVTQSGGYVKIDSAPGAGTTVRLYLPATKLPMAKTTTPHESDNHPPPLSASSPSVAVEH
jgi:PAS domain S-box-containing protein